MVSSQSPPGSLCTISDQEATSCNRLMDSLCHPVFSAASCRQGTACSVPSASLKMIFVGSFNGCQCRSSALLIFRCIHKLFLRPLLTASHLMGPRKRRASDDVSKDGYPRWFEEGTLIRKHFPGHGAFDGTITKLRKPFYFVRYSDGDEEELDRNEVIDGIKMFREFHRQVRRCARKCSTIKRSRPDSQLLLLLAARQCPYYPSCTTRKDLQECHEN